MDTEQDCFSACTDYKCVRAKKCLGALGEESAYSRGYRWGAHFKTLGIKHGKMYGAYPSNKYHKSDHRCDEYNKGYEDGFAQS